MNKQSVYAKQRSIFIFHRDLRLHDNKGLINALENSEYVIPCFIFTPDQLENNPYRSDNSVQFMLECLEDLDGQLKAVNRRLYLFYGETYKVLKKLIDKFNITAIYSNRDYTPFAIKRDKGLKEAFKNIEINICDDALLNAPDNTVKNDGKPYKIFTPYFTNSIKFPVDYPLQNKHTNYFDQPIDFTVDSAIFKNILQNNNPNMHIRGGREEALKILKDLSSYADYAQTRDYPAMSATTHLSAYLKFNVVSVREVYHAIKRSLGLHHVLMREIYWRDFFTTIGFFFPHVFGGSFNKQFDKINWDNNKQYFKAWCMGNTGFPIVDAGMRELNATGFMHNRVRMITASFLTKDLHIDWRLGERYFAQKLVDYDPAVNNGNWQWCAGTGCDAQPYFRIFNPWNQQKKFDPECVYVKRWIPELKKINPKELHRLHENKKKIANYPRPIIDHGIEAKRALMMYKV